ncbi:neuroguidin [Nilaparvata lugens]|uniref:neuroguidin n=1 Tax=Nilaparvata lugens TaxID=108931 RepID=UPI00193E4146|nr:neuroguidin [Nilaparvata lugens]XP_039281289.1 neuroguidin [Nilaparvata lugens]XP_039281290.1 neuroguidin [Nilaparvata lugens]
MEKIEDNQLTGNDIQKEMMDLIGTIDSTLPQIKDSISNLKKTISSSKPSNQKGLSILDVKNNMMLMYLSNLMHIILKKCKGESIQGDQAIERLTEIRIVLERIFPIESKLKYQIHKLIKTATTGTIDENDPSRFRANPADMEDEEDSADSDEEDDDDGNDGRGAASKRKSGIYVPPKLAAMHYDEDDSKAAKQEKLLERARKHALNSSVVQEMREEILDAPKEVGQANTFKRKQSARQREREEYEESYLTRLPIKSKEKQRSRALMTEGMLGSELTHFEDISVLDPTSERRPPLERRGNQRGRSHQEKVLNRRSANIIEFVLEVL